MSIKQWHQYIYLIWRKTWINVKELSESHFLSRWVIDKRSWRVYFADLGVFPRGQVARVGDKCWSEDYVCEFKSRCLHIFSFNNYVVFAQILIKIVHLYIIQLLYVSELPCGSYTKTNWKWIPNYADCVIRKRLSNCCLSVKHTQSTNLLSLTLSLYYTCRIGKQEVRGRQIFLSFFRDLLFIGIPI
jgi:hypothetical protein